MCQSGEPDAADTYYLFYDQSADAGAKQIDGSGYPVAPDIILAQVAWNGADTLSALVDLRRSVPHDGTRVLTARITHDGGATQALGTMPARSLLEGCFVLCEQTLAGAAGFSIILGDTADTDGILEYAQLGTTAGDLTGDTPSDQGIYLSNGQTYLRHYYPTPTAITATLAGTASEGEWVAFLVVRELPISA